MDRLPVFKALGDNTRYAIYLELARCSSPLSTSEVADTLGLHPNTVRPHLERMREVGLLDVEVDNRGSVGRPQHRYSLSAEAPSLGLEPPAFPMVARLLAQLAAALAPAPDSIAAVAHREGRDAARARGGACLDALVAELADLGFDPAVADDGAATTVAFAHCPFRDLAEVFPELVCNLHRGLIEGFVAELGGAEIQQFATLEDRDPCRVELVVR